MTRNTIIIERIVQQRLSLLKDYKFDTVQPLADALQKLAAIQHDVSMPVAGCIPEDGEMPTKDGIRTYVLAMTVELMEFVQTLDWKPWKNKTNVDRDRVIDEFADILAFQGIIIHYLELMGINPVDLAEGYRKKSIVNIERFLGRYDPQYKQVSLPGTEAKE